MVKFYSYSELAKIFLNAYAALITVCLSLRIFLVLFVPNFYESHFFKFHLHVSELLGMVSLNTLISLYAFLFLNSLKDQYFLLNDF